MCGLFGWILKPEEVNRDQRIVLGAILGKEMDCRGGDSWGVASRFSSDPFWAERGLGKIAPNYPAYNYQKFSVLIGHTRKATSSLNNICIDHAHPFDMKHGEKRLMGAHNGIISNHDALNKQYNRDFPVDSQHIFQNILEDKPLLDLEGWGAITYTHDFKEIFVGSDTQSFSVASVLKGGKKKRTVGCVWASLQSDLELALKMAGLDYTIYDTKTQKLYSARPDGLYKTDGVVKFGARTYVTTPAKHWHNVGYNNSGYKHGRSAYELTANANKQHSANGPILNPYKDADELQGDKSLEDGWHYCDKCVKPYIYHKLRLIASEYLLCDECYKSAGMYWAVNHVGQQTP